MGSVAWFNILRSSQCLRKVSAQSRGVNAVQWLWALTLQLTLHLTRPSGCRYKHQELATGHGRACEFVEANSHSKTPLAPVRLNIGERFGRACNSAHHQQILDIKVYIG